jgi:hypothetical protein
MSTQALQVRISRAGALGDVDSLYLFACQVDWRKQCSHFAVRNCCFALASPDAKSCLVPEVLLETCK